MKLFMFVLIIALAVGMLGPFFWIGLIIWGAWAIWRAFSKSLQDKGKI